MPSVDNRISVGNVLVAGTLLVSIAVAWGNLSGRADNLSGQVSTSKATIAANEVRIRALETASARQDERLVLILDGLRKIEDRIERADRLVSRP